MDRSRRMPQRRRHLGASASPTSVSEASFDSNPLTSPVVAHTNTTPQSVGGRRSTKPLQHTFSFSPPGSSRNSNPKRRSTTMDNFPIPDGGEHGPRKGGHSLRKRARVDYTFEHIDDDVVVPNSTSSARGKKRRSEVNFDTDDFYTNDPKRRGASMGADTPSNRRKNPTRKSSDLKAFHHAALQDDDNDVQDTIEVGAYYSDVDDSELREAAESNNSSPQAKMSSKGSPKKSPKKEFTQNELPGPQADGTRQLEPSMNDDKTVPEVETLKQISSEQLPSVVEPSSTSIEESVSQPAEPLAERIPKVELQPEALSARQEPSAAADIHHDVSAVEEPAAVPDARSEPAATTVSDTQAKEVEPEAVPVPVSEPVSEPISVPVSEPVPDPVSDPVSEPEPVSLPVAAPIIAPLATTDNMNNKNESVHSPIVPAAEPEPTNSVAEVPAAEAFPEAFPQHNSELDSSATNNISIKEEAPHHTTLEEVPESPDQPLNQHQENKMDEMEIDSVNQEPLAQDVEMPDAVPLDTQEPAPAAAISPPSPPPPLPSALSPSLSKTLSTPPPKSPPKSVSELLAPSPAPSPAKELEHSQDALNNTSPPADAAIEAPVPVEVNGDLTQAEQLNNDGIENNKDKDATEVVATVDELPTPDLPQAPIAQESIAQEPIAQEPIAQEPIAQEPVAQESVTQEPVAQEPVSQEPIAQEPVAISSHTELKATTPPPAETIETPASSAPSETKSGPQKPVAPRIAMESMPQPTPVGRWSHLKPYIDGEFSLYPEKKGQSNDDGTGDDANPEGKDTDMEPMVDDQDDAGEGGGLEAPTPALNTPTRGSPVADSADPTAFNSPAPIGEDGDEADVSESQELPGRNRYYKYRKLRDPEEYIAAVENYEDMSTEDLYDILEAINLSLVQWQDEWTDQGAIVDDHENALRRRAADAKYEARTRNLRQHGVNFEEPEFAVKGSKSRDREGLNETRYLQGQDRIMAATYGFEYDPHPSKIGKQNPETQQVGIMTRGRSLRNQPKQTAKATETDEVVGKRQRKPVQLFDPATQDVSRSSTPVPTTRGGARRRKNANGDDDVQPAPTVSFNEAVSDGEAAGPKTRRKRGTRGKNAASAEDPVSTLEVEEAAQEELSKSTRRSRARPAVKYEEADPNEFVDDEPQEEEEDEEEVEEKEEKPPVRRHLLTLKLPKGFLAEVTPDIEMADNGDSRPTTASSEESAHTVESAYSFRPKRQKRFRDDPDETEESAQAPPKKRGKRTSGGTTTSEIPSAASTPAPSIEPAQAQNNRKIQKIKVVRSGQDTKNGGAPPPPPPPPAPAVTPVEEGDDSPKDYKSMTKSEKMSASMKNRWANGNMAGAVEKRKATLAAKKAAQAAAEQRTGVVAPKPKGNKATVKRDSTLKMHMQPDQPQVPQQQQQQQQPQQQPPMLHQQPSMHPHQHQHHQLPPQPQHQHQHPDQYQHQHQHQHPHHSLHLQQQQQPQMHQPHPHHLPPPPPPHQPGNPPPPFIHGHGQHHNHGHGHGMPGMGYPY